MLPVANYLDGLSNLVTAAQAGISGSSSSGGLGGQVPSFGGGGALDTGTKPKALHTEYASGEANWQKPYATGEDLVFYLIRADKGGNGASNTTGTSGEDSLGIFSPGESQNALGGLGFSGELGMNFTEGMEAVGPVFGAADQTGIGFPLNLQSPLNQVAVSDVTSGFPSFISGAKGLAGPLTGLNPTQEVPIGGFSQTFAKLSSTIESVTNLTQYVPSLESLKLSNPSSEQFFTEVLTSSFIPDVGQKEVSGAIKTAQEIESTLSNGSIADLSTMMSIATGGVTTAQQLIEGINKGLIGFTTQGSGAQADILGPQGYSRERLAK